MEKEGLRVFPSQGGKQRAMLANLGLQGKVTFTSVMSEDDIRSEIRSAFMENDSSSFYISSNIRLWWKDTSCSISLYFFSLECARGVKARQNMFLHFSWKKTCCGRGTAGPDC